MDGNWWDSRPDVIAMAGLLQQLFDTVELPFEEAAEVLKLQPGQHVVEFRAARPGERYYDIRNSEITDDHRRGTDHGVTVIR